jgi:hypothetical protein
MMRTLVVGSAAALWLAQSGCDRATERELPRAPPSQKTAPPAVTATVRPIAGMAVAARVEIVAHRSLDVFVRYGSDKTYGLMTPRLAVPAGGTLSTTIIGLHPSAVNHVEVVARGQDGALVSTGDLTVETEAMPPDLPGTLEVALARPRLDGYVLLAINDLVRSRGFAAMIDHGGRVVWYRTLDERVSVVDRLPNGHFVVHPKVGPGDFEEIEIDGTVVRTWKDPQSEAGTDGHDFKWLSNGHMLLIGQDIRTADTRRVFKGGAEHATRFDQTVTEVAADGAVVWRWSTFSHVSESEISPDPERPIDPEDYEVAHLNSIEPLPDGNLMLSFRDMSSVAKIDRSSGKILWRLGGEKSDFRFVSDPLGGFSRQHDARRLPNGNVLLFDNGNGHHPSESRPVEYRLDHDAKTATMVWQYRRSSPLFAKVAGSTRRMPNGNTLISYGPLGVVVEVDAGSEPVWEVRPPGGVFRALPIATLYP